jgi:hypothetical protein
MSYCLSLPSASALLRYSPTYRQTKVSAQSCSAANSAHPCTACNRIFAIEGYNSRGNTPNNLPGLQGEEINQIVAPTPQNSVKYVNVYKCYGM